MNKHYLVLFVLFSVLFVFCLTIFPQYPKKDSLKYHQWWNERFPGELKKKEDSKLLPEISVKGNRFINSIGDTILFPSFPR